MRGGPTKKRFKNRLRSGTIRYVTPSNPCKVLPERYIAESLSFQVDRDGDMPQVSTKTLRTAAVFTEKAKVRI